MLLLSSFMMDERATLSKVVRNSDIPIIGESSKIGDSILGLSKAAVTSSNTVIKLVYNYISLNI